MRTLIDIPKDKLDALAVIAARRKMSRAAAVREAIAAYVEAQGAAEIGNGFGLWGKRKQDGLARQRKLRSEW